MKKMWVKRFYIAALFSVSLCLAGAASCFALTKSHEYGNVTMSSSSSRAAAPVTFRHWSHRDKYTCRLCHVDLEFAQMANGTGVLEEDNQDGLYCGACHNGKEAFGLETCTKCHPKDSSHSNELAQQAKRAFRKFKKTMPPSMYGNKIDWMKAEEDGTITPKDFLPGITLKKTSKMINQRDEPRSPKLPGLPEIIFSHSKHVVWSGCGMCHPDTFALETGKTNMTMKAITEGKFCGRCHGTIAFALNDCSRCHSKPVQ